MAYPAIYKELFANDGAGPKLKEELIPVEGGDGVSVTGGTVAVDGTVVRTDSEQTITGVKTFASSAYVTDTMYMTATTSGNDSAIIVKGNNTVRGTTYTAPDAVYINLTDSTYTQGEEPSNSQLLGKIGLGYFVTGFTQAFIEAAKPEVSENYTPARISVMYPAEGEPYTLAPSTRATPNDREIVTVDYLNNRLASLESTSYGPVAAVSDSELDVSTATVFTKTISAATTFTFTGVPSGKAACFSLVLTNGGSATVTWPSNVNWASGEEPELTTSGVDVLTFITPDGGTTWYGALSIAGA